MKKSIYIVCFLGTSIFGSAEQAIALLNSINALAENANGLTTTIIGHQNKEIDAKTAKEQLELAREAIRFAAINEEIQQKIALELKRLEGSVNSISDSVDKEIKRNSFLYSDIKSDQARMDNKINLFHERLSVLNVIGNDQKEINKAMDSLRDRLNSLNDDIKSDQKRVNEVIDSLDENQRNIIIGIAALSFVTVTTLVGYIIYHESLKEEKLLPDNFETKQKVLQQLEVSRSAYEVCTKSNELLESRSKKSCDVLFADFLKSEKLFRNAFSQ